MLSGESLNPQQPSRRNWFSFLSLMVMQVQNSFNDKAVQFLLVALGVTLSKLSSSSAGILTGSIEYVLAGLIMSPFILFAPIAGWIGDRYSKTQVIRLSSWFQLAVLLLLFVSVSMSSIDLAIVSFFLLAVQSAFLSPAKMGIIKELVGTKKLAFASGIVEMGTILAILFGSILVSFWYDMRVLAGLDAWEAVSLPILLVLCLGPISVLASYGIEVVPAASKRPFRRGLFLDHIRQLNVVLRDRVLRLGAFGVAFFWTFGGFIQLVSVQIAKEVNVTNVAGEGRSLAWMMLVAGMGIALGSLLASLISKRGIELGLVPIGGLGMVVGSVVLGFCTPESGWFYAAMLVAGMGAAMFLVPLNATLQDACEPSERGSVLAGSNLLNCCGGLAAVGFQLVLKQAGFSVSSQFFLFGVLALAATMFAIRILPQQVVRFVVLALFRLIYRVKIERGDYLPLKGGVLMVANHVSYIDSFVLSAASSRPIRFLMDEKFMKQGGLVTLFTRLFDTVPISPTRAKEAIQIAADALKEGAVVCIFPEGQLTRSGCMNEIKKGFQVIARKARVPVIPVYMDGIWGSISSFERRRYLGKKPYVLQYGLTVAFGEPLPAKVATAEKVRFVLNQLAEQAFLEREIFYKPSKVFAKSLEILDGDAQVLRECLIRMRTLSVSEQRFWIRNALQLAEGYSFQRSMSIILEAEVLQKHKSLIVPLALVLRLKLLVAGPECEPEDLQLWKKTHDVGTVLGEGRLKDWFAQSALDIDYYEIGGGAMPADQPKSYTIGLHEGIAITRSSPHPHSDNPNQQFQPGWKEGSIGRLLPGFSVREFNEEEFELRCGSETDKYRVQGRIDEEGFVFLITESPV